MGAEAVAALPRVWRVQREHAHTAWTEIFGDEPLPPIGSAAEWTQWVLGERRRTPSDIEQSLAGEVCLPPYPALRRRARP